MRLRPARSCRLHMAERALPIDAALLPVPPDERTRRVSFVHTWAAPPAPKAGCLVSAEAAWVIRPDRTRHFLPRPPAECLARATPIEDTFQFPQARRRQGLRARPQTAWRAAARRLLTSKARAPCRWAPVRCTRSGARRLFCRTAAACDRWSTQGRHRRGQRGHVAPHFVTGGHGRSDAARSGGRLLHRSFDMPGHVLAPSRGGEASSKAVSSLSLQRADANDAAQLAQGSGKGGDGFVFTSGRAGGGVLSMRKRAAPPSNLVVPHRGTAISREWEIVLLPQPPLPPTRCRRSAWTSHLQSTRRLPSG